MLLMNNVDMVKWFHKKFKNCYTVHEWDSIYPDHEVLLNLIAEFNIKTILEVGCYKGINNFTYVVTDPQEREARAVHDLLRSERHNWQQFVGALPGPGKLQAIYAQRDNSFLRLSTADLEMTQVAKVST